MRCLVHPLILAAMSLILSSSRAESLADESGKTPAREVTIKGNVLCTRATVPKPWNWDPGNGDHTPILLALEGTSEIEADVRRLMEHYPKQGLDVEGALRIQAEFDAHLKFFLAPGPLTTRIHKEVEAGSQLLALTGMLSEKDGKRWIAVTGSRPARVKYPDEMLVADTSSAPAGKEPIVLKLGDGRSLRCILLPVGRFLQGSPFYQRRYQDEYPHEVVLTRPFAMSETPVTQEIFQAVMGQNPSLSKGPEQAVTGVPFADIEEFCRRVSRRNGLTVRLPTDAEWEYAARVGTSNPCMPEKYLKQVSAVGRNPDTTPVRSRQPNAWGLYDMLCGGWHVTGDYKSDNVRVKQVDPKGPAVNDPSVHGDTTGKLHKTRGGPHYDHIRPNIHGAATPKGTLWEAGSLIFRVVVEPAPGKR